MIKKDKSLRCPNFFIIGAGRSGTTSFCTYLDQHPEILISNPKETGFFSENYHKGWSWYESCFKDKKGVKVCGEGTVNYAKQGLFPNVIPRMLKDLSDIRLIYIVRDPIKRIESDWRYTNIRGYETLPFLDAISQNWIKYVEPSDYLMQIDAYRKYISDDKILVLFFEDLKNNPNEVLKQCFHFLGVDEKFFVEDLSVQNKGDKGFQHSKMTSFLTKVRGLQTIKNILPKGVWEMIKPLFGRQVLAPEIVWSDELYDQVKDALSENTKKFLLRYGKSKDFWSFDKK